MHVHLLETAMAPRAGTCASSSWTQRLTGVPRDRRGGDGCLRDGPASVRAVGATPAVGSESARATSLPSQIRRGQR